MGELTTSLRASAAGESCGVAAIPHVPGEMLATTPRPRRPLLRYYGGKWRLGPWICDHLPPHGCYVEPFAGAASVLLQKAPVPSEVLNDLDRELVSFFRVLRRRTAELVRAIELTPFARAEYEAARDRGDLWESDELEAARRLYVCCWQAFHAGLRPNKSGWRHCKGTSRKTTAAHEFADVEHLWAIVARLRTVQLECSPALEVIARFDTPHTCFYVDPPYPKTTRSHRWGRDAYKHELGTAEEHEELAETLHRVRGMVVLSGYRSELYDRLYADWARADKRTQTLRGGGATESLWLSPSAVDGLRSRWPMFWRQA